MGNSQPPGESNPQTKASAPPARAVNDSIYFEEFKERFRSLSDSARQIAENLDRMADEHVQEATAENAKSKEAFQLEQALEETHRLEQEQHQADVLAQIMELFSANSARSRQAFEMEQVRRAEQQREHEQQQSDKLLRVMDLFQSASSVFENIASEATRAHQAVAEAEKRRRNIDQSRTCKVCFEEDCNVVFQPCFHICCCEGCAESLQACPICRTRVHQTNKVYF